MLRDFYVTQYTLCLDTNILPLRNLIKELKKKYIYAPKVLIFSLNKSQILETVQLLDFPETTNHAISSICNRRP